MTNRWAGGPIPDALWAAVIDIYREAFPASERCDEDELRASIEAGQRSMWTIGEVDAFLIAKDLTTAPPWIFGEYLAVRSDARSGGFGSSLLTALAATGRPMVIEVEDPQWAGPIAERRIRFYERSGAHRLAGSEGFLAPDLETIGQYVPMWLLELPFGTQREPDPALGARLARTIWTEGYGLAPDSPELSRLVSRLRNEP